jgi:hypothetical protein
VGASTRFSILTILAAWIVLACGGRSRAQVSLEEAQAHLNAKKSVVATQPATLPVPAGQPDGEPVFSDEDWLLVRAHVDRRAKYLADLAEAKKKVSGVRAVIAADEENITAHTVAQPYTVRLRGGMTQTNYNYVLNDPGGKLQGKLADDRKALAEALTEQNNLIENWGRASTIDAAKYKLAIDWLIAHPETHQPKPIIVAAPPATEPSIPQFTWTSKPATQPIKPQVPDVVVATQPARDAGHGSIFHDPSLHE